MTTGGPWQELADEVTALRATVERVRALCEPTQEPSSWRGDPKNTWTFASYDAREKMKEQVRAALADPIEDA